MRRLMIAICVAGTFLVHHGWREYQFARGASEQPMEISLSEIEAGALPTNPHLRIGDHWRMYQELVIAYRSDQGGDAAQPGLEQALDYSYYPVLAVDNPFFQEVERLERHYGSVGAIPDDQYPQEIVFRVLVRSEEFASVDGLPAPAWTLSRSVEGLLVNEVRSLTNEERALVAGAFPSLDVDGLLILEAGRRPSSLTTSYAFMGGGIVLSLLPLAGFVRRSTSRQGELISPSDDPASPYATPEHDHLAGRTDSMGGPR